MTKNSGRKTKNIGRRHATRPIGRKTKPFGQEPLRTGRPAAALDVLFGSRAIGRLLKVFFLNPSRDFYQRELSSVTGERLFLIQNALKRLMEGGLIEATQRGNRTYFRANRSYPAFPELESLILKTFGLGDQVREAIDSLAPRIRVAFIYGSAARGEDKNTSDIDILVVGQITSRDLAAALAPVKESLSREINASIYRAEEFRSGVLRKHPFLREVLHGPKIFLVGDHDQIRAVLTRKQTPTAQNNRS